MIVDQLDCGEKISGEFVVARGDATEMLEFVEEARSRTWGREFHQSSGNLSAHCGALALAPKRPETRRRAVPIALDAVFGRHSISSGARNREFSGLKP